MLKRFMYILLIWAIFSSFIVGAEYPVQDDGKIFLYLYTNNCGYCVKFNPVYNKISNKYGKDCKFLKINANSEYGNDLMRSLRAAYVPFVALIDNSDKTVKSVNPDCLLSYACTQDVMDKFVK